MNDPYTAQLKENVLAAQVEAVLQNHNLGAFEQVQEENYRLGYEAACKKCGKSVYVNQKVVYSILPTMCRGLKRGRRRPPYPQGSTEVNSRG